MYANLTTDADKIVLVTQSNNKFRFRFRALDGIKSRSNVTCSFFFISSITKYYNKTGPIH